MSKRKSRISWAKKNLDRVVETVGGWKVRPFKILRNGSNKPIGILARIVDQLTIVMYDKYGIATNNYPTFDLP
jgi:hypothetical protein